MVTEKITISCEAVFDSKEKQHRYSMIKVWDEKLPQAAVISIAPSSDCGVSADLTTQLIQNNLDGLRFGGFVLTNLFSLVGCEFKKLKSTDELYNKETDKAILASCEKADVIIICWGGASSKNKLISKRAEDVIKLVSKFGDKLHFLSDGKRTQLHPLTPKLRHKWLLVKATVSNEVPVGSWDGEVSVAS